VIRVILMMVRSPAQDGLSAVQLLKQHDARKFMGQGHGTEAQNESGA